MYEQSKYNSRVWLSPAHWNRKNIIIEHPACLTSEERATDLGASTNRQPRLYDRVIEAECDTGMGMFYEYIFFNSMRQARSFDDYLSYLENADLYKNVKGDEESDKAIYRVRFENKYGKFNAVAKHNILRAKQFYSMFKTLNQNSVSSSTNRSLLKILESDVPSNFITENKNFISINVATQDLIPVAAMCYIANIDFIIIPKNSAEADISAILQLRKKQSLMNLEMIGIVRDSSRRLPRLIPNSLIYGSGKSKILHQMLLMSATIESIPDIFKSSYMFISRIRCTFIERAEPLPADPDLTDSSKKILTKILQSSKHKLAKLMDRWNRYPSRKLSFADAKKFPTGKTGPPPAVQIAEYKDSPPVKRRSDDLSRPNRHVKKLPKSK
jgi:hypothetical protein